MDSTGASAKHLELEHSQMGTGKCVSATAKHVELELPQLELELPQLELELPQLELELPQLELELPQMGPRKCARTKTTIAVSIAPSQENKCYLKRVRLSEKLQLTCNEI